MLYRIAAVIVLAAISFGCGKNLTDPTEVVKSEAQMEGGNLEVSLPLPEWLKAKLSALPAGKLASGDTGPVAIYVVVSRTAAGGVETQSFPLVPDLTAGVARGSVKIDIGQITVQAFYSENGQMLFQSRPVPVAIAPDKKYQITFKMERVETAVNVNFTATWDTTKVEEVVITDSPPPTPYPYVLTVSMVPNNLAAATILSDSDPSTYPQSNIAFLAVNFTVQGSSPAKVTAIKFKRNGISADNDIGNLYLYDGDNRLAEFYSFSDKVATFQNEAGLFIVNPGDGKTITLKGDLARDNTSVTSGKTMGFSLESVNDIMLDGQIAVNGAFPIVGSLMSTAAVADLGHVYLTAYSTFPFQVRPDARDQELWQFTVNASSQDMETRYIKMTMVGTVASDEIRDLRLEVNGQPISGTEQLNPSDKTVTFDLTGNPCVIRSGQAKVIVLRGSMNGGAGKVFKFTVQRQADIVAYDRNYGVYNPVTHTGDTTAWSLIEPTYGNGTLVTDGVPVPVPIPGDITVGPAEDSPVGNVIDGAIGVPLAKFSYTARGEDILVSSLGIAVGMVNADQGEYSLALKNVKILLDGTQIGVTQSEIVSSTTATTYSFDHNFLIKNGQTRVVTVVADLTHANLEVNDTISITLAPDLRSGNAQGLSSMAILLAPRQPLTARTLTVKSGVVAVAKNTAFADRSAAMPTGVAGATNVQIASFVITAGYEQVDVWQIVVRDPNSVTQLGDNFQNLRLMRDGGQIGETIGTLDRSGTTATYSFRLSPSIRLDVRQQYVVDVYADILSSPQDPRVVLSPVIVMDAVGAVGVATGNNAGLSYGQFIALQNGYISMGGSLTVITSADPLIDQILVMGETDRDVFRFKLSAGPDEDILVSDILVGAVTDPFYPGGTFRNAKLYQGSTQLGATSVWVKWTAPMSTNNYMVAGFWNLSLRIPRNSSVTLTLKVDVSTNSEGATSGFSAVFYLLPDYDGLAAGNQPSIVARGANSAMSLTGDALRFQGAGGPGGGVLSNQTTVYATKISVAWVSDTPSGASTPQAGQVVAKFTISDSANVGLYSAVIRAMKFVFTTSGVTVTGSDTARVRVDLIVYKDFLHANNVVGTTSWFGTPSGTSLGTVDLNNVRSTVAPGSVSGFNDVGVASGESKTFIVTLDTNGLSMDRVYHSFVAISISIPSGGIVWRDGVGINDITTAEGLPLAPKIFTY